MNGLASRQRNQLTPAGVIDRPARIGTRQIIVYISQSENHWHLSFIP
jgi:hypothetical protein